ncbi:hypothetical protein GPECTOR_1g581 [Gonium pectorale]|uniref:Uncharacterized protein n=1 Tax=Gonium pectorale TaxID=33097 RepID=A0A150H3P0_GONPE|nr:hypothetical protein GPECTOR_1g581 [Gonium pectorale]|eukprot:KXZ56645.1 hypothetical protein GPECTOR_1g581 [Gonium pectorale]
MDKTGAWSATFQYDDLLQYQLESGVFVQSDSWGREKTYWYDTLCKQLDEVTWRQPQLLVVTAAGNDGTLLPPSASGGTVSSPSNAKNTLSVGSSASLTPSGLTQGMLLLLVWTGSPTPPDVDPDVVAALLGDGLSEESYASLPLGDFARRAAPPTATRADRRAAVEMLANTDDTAASSSLYMASPEDAAQAAEAAGRSDGASPPPSPPGAPDPLNLKINELVQLQLSVDFRTLRDLDGVVLEAVASSPVTACRPLSNSITRMPPDAAPGEESDLASDSVSEPDLPKIYVALRGDCMNYVKVLAAAAAGGAAVAIVNNAPGAMPRQLNPTNATLPVAPLSQELGSRVLAALAAGQRVFMRPTWQPQPPHDNVPSYSSYGPTSDGRIKPEVVAPGSDVLSAMSDMVSTGQNDNCQQRGYMSGTSMSTPLVAGSAVLAREYFTMGFYPLGRNDTPGSARFNPSGMLLRAVLIGGAYNMAGVSIANLQPLQPAPSPYQGFGRVDLAASLPLSPAAGGADAPPPPPSSSSGSGCFSPRLQLVDMVPIREGDVHTYRLAAPGTGPIVVTLAWADAPADQLAAVSLVNNLDLEVKLTPATVSVGGTGGTGAATPQPVTYLGNADWVASYVANKSSNAARGGRDNRNNVERVVLRARAKGALEAAPTPAAEAAAAPAAEATAATATLERGPV